MSNLWKQFIKPGSIEREPGQSRSKAETVDEDHSLPTTARSNKSETVSQLTRDLYAKAVEF